MPTPQNGHTYSNSSSAICRGIVWVFLTILWGWYLKGYWVIRCIELTHFWQIFSFCTPIKYQENQRFSAVFRGCKMGTLARNELTLKVSLVIFWDVAIYKGFSAAAWNKRQFSCFPVSDSWSCGLCNDIGQENKHSKWILDFCLLHRKPWVLF